MKLPGVPKKSESLYCHCNSYCEIKYSPCSVKKEQFIYNYKRIEKMS